MVCTTQIQEEKVNILSGEINFHIGVNNSPHPENKNSKEKSKAKEEDLGIDSFSKNDSILNRTSQLRQSRKEKWKNFK